MAKRLKALYARIPDDLFRRAKAEAARRGWSLAELVIAALVAFLGGHE